MNDELIFAAEPESKEQKPKGFFRILIVDDEPEIHKVTKIALEGFKFRGKGLDFTSVYSGEEAREVLREESGFALILLDVVMESEYAGLELVSFIRNDMDYRAVRIILRTGQPGQAPERKVIEDYDINDYKAKTELTSQKLFTLMHASLRSYNDIITLELTKQGLRKVIEASRGIFDKHAFDSFVSGAVRQIVYLLDLDQALIVSNNTKIFKLEDGALNKFSCIDHQGKISTNKLDELPEKIQELVDEAIKIKSNVVTDESILIYCENRSFTTMFYLYPNRTLSSVDRELLNIFTENIVVALENIRLEGVIKENQKEIIYRLGEIVENRSKETGNHVKRVALYSELLAKLYGLNDEEVEIVKLASPLHDIGKIAIPDAILHKPAKLDAEEWEIMQSHAAKGGEMLENSDLVLLKAGAFIAGHHHEKWDGSGYPNGLQGEEIHIYGRIAALADVFDALGSKRAYKEPWTDEDIFKLIKEQRGIHFDPKLVDLMFDNIDRFLRIRGEFKD